MPTMKMGPVSNPANNDKMKVQPDVPKPPPVTPVTNPRDVGEGGAILDKDLILAAQGANGSILNAGLSKRQRFRIASLQSIERAVGI